ncbi:MAG: hypothetical protein NUV90_01065 [Candidatus Parcubacteria bacterium]|nr:hypothetical protein [Candidatus Parcubacteria bacterium]
MTAHSVGQVAPSRANVREAVQRYRRISQREQDHGYWGLDRRCATGYDLEAKWRNRIFDFFRELKKQRKKFVYVDICGRANGRYLGADATYTFSLQSTDRLWSFERDEGTHIRGDFFNPRDFYGFIRLLRRKRVAPAFVTFHPVAGLQSYTPHDEDAEYQIVIHQRLENNLRKVIEILRPGGYIHLGTPFQFFGMDLRDFLMHVPKEQWESHIWLKTFCRSMRCSVEWGYTGDQKCHLIRKWMPNQKK